LAAIVALGSPALAGGQLWLLKLLIDRVLVEARTDLLPMLLGGYVVAVLTKVGTDYVGVRAAATVSEGITRDVRAALFSHLVSLSPGSLGRLTLGDGIARLSGDADRVETLIFSGPLGVLEDAANVALFAGVLFALSLKLTVLALLVVPPLAWLISREAPRVKRAAKIARHEAGRWFGIAEEALAAVPLIHAFGARERVDARFARRCDAARRAELRTVWYQARLALLIESAIAVGVVVVLTVGSHEIRTGTMTLGAVVAFLASLRALYDPLRGLGKATARFQRAAAGAERVAAALSTPSLIVEHPLARPLRRVRGGIEWRHVTYAYPAGEPVLHDVSLRVEPGEMVAIVGASGSGKSTLVSLLARLADPTSGAVLIDGIDVRSVTLASLRESVGIVFQDPYLLRGRVADNIRFGRPHATVAEVQAAAEAAHAHRFIDALPAGYAAPVGVRGERLSGGQRQRLALARALVREAPILVLDEATASVDGETDELIHDAVEQLARRRTIILIGHRLSTVRRADRVVVIDGGRVVETGRTDELLSGRTRFHDLFAAQVKARGAGL